MVSSTLAISAFFLLIELVERIQDPAATVLAVTMEAYGDDMDEEETEEEVGVLIPATLAALGICFAGCAVLLAGLPPLSGFIAKFTLIAALFNPDGLGGSGEAVTVAAWVLIALLLLSGLAGLIAMTRIGIRTFWAPIDGTVPRVLVMEFVPVALLLALCLAMTIQGGTVMRYMDATARSLHAPADYIGAVLSAKRVPSPVTDEAR